MAFRIEKRISAYLSAALLLASVSFGAQEFRYDARSKQMRETGVLTITASGVSFQPLPKNGKQPRNTRKLHWDYQDIQQLTLGTRTLNVLTYHSSKWMLGSDSAYDFEQSTERTFQDAYEFLRTRLDQRFVAAVPGELSDALWRIPAKHLAVFGGDEGVLQAGSDQIVFKSPTPDDSRTWRYKDIENISSSGPFQLTITTFERARTHYASLKEFNFQLKEQLGQTRYDELWLRLNQSKGLAVLNTYQP